MTGPQIRYLKAWHWDVYLSSGISRHCGNGSWMAKMDFWWIQMIRTHSGRYSAGAQKIMNYLNGLSKSIAADCGTADRAKVMPEVHAILFKSRWSLCKLGRLRSDMSKTGPSWQANLYPRFVLTEQMPHSAIPPHGIAAWTRT